MKAHRIGVVTGASSGIGRAVAVRRARQGTNVIAAGRRADRLAALVDELAEQPGQVVPFVGDIVRPGWTEELLAAAEREWGPADLAVLRQLRACAAEFVKQAMANDSDWTRDLVVVGSTVGRQVSAANSVYGSTKFALHSLVESLHQEVCAHDIRVTLIEPGFVRSGFQAAAGYDPAWFNSVAEQNGPLLLPEDVADVVDFVIGRPGHVHLDDIRLRPTRQNA